MQFVRVGSVTGRFFGCKSPVGIVRRFMTICFLVKYCPNLVYLD